MKIEKQQGQVLIFSMILLVILSILAVASIRNSQLEQKIALIYEDKAYALKVAEYSLSIIKKKIVEKNFSIFEFTGNCYESDCFNVNCKNGYCLNYQISDYGFCHDNELQFQSKSASLMENSINKGVNIWENRHYHQVLSEQYFNEAKPSKYVIEFLCVKKHDEYEYVDLRNKQSWAFVFRISVQSYGKNENTKALLQSIVQIG